MPRTLIVGLVALTSVAVGGLSSAAARQRIVGGSAAASGAYPAQAYIKIDFLLASASCGGTLIARTKVVTAAHCLDAANASGGLLLPPSAVSPDAVHVSLGSNARGAGTTQTAAGVQLHPDYAPGTSANDIAVITLPQPAAEAPLALADPATDTADYAVGSPATVIGWGATSDGGAGSSDLLQAEVPIVSDADCNDANSYAGTLVPAVMLCAGLAAGGRDSCQGDSGGPLMVRSAGVLKLVGVVSFGDGCAKPDKYGVYTEVPATPIRSFLAAEAGAPPSVAIADVANAAAGTPVSVRATATDPTAGGGITEVLWDLDADGEFDDASGEQVTWTPAAAGDARLRVLVRDSDGMAAAAARTVAVAPGPTPTPTPTPAPAPPPPPPAAGVPSPDQQIPSAGDPGIQPAPRARGIRLARLSARPGRGVIVVSGALTGASCAGGRVRITLSRGAKRLERRPVRLSSRCAFTSTLRGRGRLTVVLDFVSSRGKISLLGSKTRRVP